MRHTGGEIPPDQGLSRIATGRRSGGGARVELRTYDGAVSAGHDSQFVVRPDGRLDPAAATSGQTPEQGDAVVLLGPAPGR